MDHAQLKELLALEAMDRLEGEERRAMHEHLVAGCDECEAELRELRETLAAMAAASAPQDSPQVSSVDRVWDLFEARRNAAAPTPKAVPDRGVRAVVALWQTTTALALAAAIIVAIGLGNRMMRLDAAARINSQHVAQLRVSLHQMIDHLKASETELIILRGELSRSRQLTEIALEPDSRVVRLAGLAAAPSAKGLVAISPTNRRAIVQISGLPPAPPNKVYELWWIGARSGPIKAALFVPGTRGTITIGSDGPPPGEQMLASAVTLEPAGGVEKPTGAMYLKGAFTN